MLDKEQIDLLLESASDGGAVLMQDLLKLFIEENAPRLTELDYYIKQRDIKALDRVAHFMAGSSANIGALRLSKFCQELENLDESADFNHLRKISYRVRINYLATVEAFQEVIEGIEPQ